MPPIAWLVVAIAAGVAAYLMGWPPWRAYRSGGTRATNRERYLAWRGRAVRGQPSAREGMTGEERRRIYVGAALGAIAVAALLAFFAAS